LECGSLLPPLGCGYLQGASKLAHSKTPPSGALLGKKYTALGETPELPGMKE